jgi:hypothetical protein
MNSVRAVFDKIAISLLLGAHMKWASIFEAGTFVFAWHSPITDKLLNTEHE